VKAFDWIIKPLAGIRAARRRLLQPAKRSTLRPRLEVLEDRTLPSVSAQEQLFVYLINRARHNPVAYQQETDMPADLSTVAARPPLAVNDQLIASAGHHAEEMAAHNYFGHQSAVTGAWPNAMARAAGYPLPSSWGDNANYIESIAAGYSTAASALYALILDQGVPGLGHRNHLLGIDSFFASHREIGVGYGTNDSSLYKTYWAIHSARVSPADVFLTGVVYNDANASGRYDLGEGLGGVTVTAGSVTTITNAAGGWSLKVQGSQTYQVTATGAGFVGSGGTTVAVGAANVEVDFISGWNGAMVNFGPVWPPANQAPVLQVIPDQTMPAGQDTLTVLVSASDPDGNALSYSARAYDLTWVARQLDDQLGLSHLGNYNQNAHGSDEKWMSSTLSGDWYCLLPNGELRRWSGSWSATLGSGGLVATLDSSYYADPARLWNAPPPVTPPVNLSFSGSQLTIDPTAGYRGRFFVEVTVSDGSAAASRTFSVTVANGTPVIAAITDRTMHAAADKITVALSASDPDGDPLTFSARALEVGREAYDLDQWLGLGFPGSYYENGHGRGEKWMTSASGDWYCIVPSGEVRRWTGSDTTTFGAAGLIATLDSSYHADPSRLWNAPAPALPPVSFSFSGNQVTIDPAAGYLGTFTVEISASDGISSTSRSFQVTVTNAAPVLTTVPNQTMASGQDLLTLGLSATDADGDALTYAARITAVTPLAYQLDAQLGLSYAGSYYENAHGFGEKWLSSTLSGDWYCILPSGEVRRWTGSDTTTFGPAGLIATLDASYHADPSKLWNAQLGLLSQVAVSVTGNQLRLDPIAGFLGTFTVETAASDGLATNYRTFTVTVS